MKLITAIASAAVIGASFLVPNSAEAKVGPPYESKIHDYIVTEELWEIGMRPYGNNVFSASVATFKPPVRIANGCPAGTSYHKIRVGGLIKRTAAQGCFTDFQASQLRMQANQNQQQRLRDFQNNLNDAFRSPVNCTTNVFGNTGYTNCY